MQNEQLSQDFFSLGQAAKYAHVERQAIYLAIKHRGLKAEKVNGRWHIKREDLDEYRSNKYNRDLRKQDGEYIFDMDKGHFSVSQVCKVLSESLGRRYSLQHIYYRMRKGYLKAFKKGAAWVISKEDAINLLEEERGKEELKHVSF